MAASLARPTRARLVLAALALLAILCAVLFLTLGARGPWNFVLPFRGQRLGVLVLVAYAIAVSTVLFQTVTANRILTPAIMGFDALYVLIQTAVVTAFGAGALALGAPHWRFLAETLLMAGFAWALFRWLFLGEERSLHLTVLVGIVFGLLFRSLSAFGQRLLDPNAFQVLQDQLFASFSGVDRGLLMVAVAITALASFALWRMGPVFDVIALGRSHAINLGVAYRRDVMAILLLVSVLVAVSTALVGPVTFFGLLVASLARLLVGTTRHAHVLPAASLLGIVCLVGGQMVLERIFAFDTALSIVVEFAGGIVFLVLVVRGAAR